MANAWRTFCRALCLESYVVQYGASNVDEVMLYLFALASDEREADPSTRTLSLEKTLDFVWHELIVDEFLYKALMDKLVDLTGRRPWHIRAPLEEGEHAGRVAAWKQRRAFFTPTTRLGKRSRSADGADGAGGADADVVTVKSLTGTTTVVRGLERGRSGVLDLKRKIHELTGMPSDQQRIISENRELNDTQLVPTSSFGGPPLHYVLCLRGC